MPEVPPNPHDPDAGEPAAGDPTMPPRYPARPPFGAPPPAHDAGVGERSSDEPSTSPRPPFGAPPPIETTPPPPWAAPQAPRPAATGPFGAPASPPTTGIPSYGPPATIPELPAGAQAPEAVAEPKRRRALFRPFARGLREVAETVILALLIFLLVRSVVQNFQVEGRSMEPTLESSWYLLVNKALYWEINLETVNKFVPFVDPGDDPTRYVFRGPQRGDVIVFKSPTSGPGQPERDFIKRIIGMPGDTVEVHDCTVFIDGQPLDEPYIADVPRYTYGPETVPPGHFFVLGDNRNNSSDSQNWGMLPKENIIGRAWLTYWPFGSFGLIDNTSVDPGGSPNQQVPAASCG